MNERQKQLLDKCEQMNVKVFKDKAKNKLVMQYDGIQISTTDQHDNELNADFIEYQLEQIETNRFYDSEDYQAEFNRQLEIAILATRGGGSGARAVRDTLLSLYNGSCYKANLSDWYCLDRQNRNALLYILEHHTFNHAFDIHEYLPQYINDFERMKKEVA